MKHLKGFLSQRSLVSRQTNWLIFRLKGCESIANYHVIKLISDAVVQSGSTKAAQKLDDVYAAFSKFRTARAEFEEAIKELDKELVRIHQQQTKGNK